MSRTVIIGGSSGIGLAVAQLVQARGHDVTVISRNADRADVDAEKVSIDITDTPRLRSFMQQLGPFEHLVCTSTYHENGDLREIDLTNARRAFEVKFWGVLEAIQASDVRESVVLVSGVSAATPWRDGHSTIAGAVCAALEAVARSLAIDLAPVRVNAISPGTIDTPLFSKMPPDDRRAMLDHYANVLPSGRVGTPADVAEAIWLLLTNGFVTGEVLFVDGGHRLVAP